MVIGSVNILNVFRFIAGAMAIFLTIFPVGISATAAQNKYSQLNLEPLKTKDWRGLTAKLRNCAAMKDENLVPGGSITVSFSLAQNGRIVAGSIELISPSSIATPEVLQNIENAIRQCEGTGFVLPPEKYVLWKNASIFLDPNRRQILPLSMKYCGDWSSIINYNAVWKVNYCLHEGMDVSEINNDGEFFPQAILRNPTQETVEILDILVNNGLNLNIKDKQGQTALHYVQASTQNNFAEVIGTKLIKYGSDVNIADIYGSTPLHLTGYNTAKFIRTLIQSGANINAVDLDGLTPLYGLVFFKNAEGVRAMLDAGADPSIGHKRIWRVVVENGLMNTQPYSDLKPRLEGASDSISQNNTSNSYVQALDNNLSLSDMLTKQMQLSGSLVPFPNAEFSRDFDGIWSTPDCSSAESNTKIIAGRIIVEFYVLKTDEKKYFSRIFYITGAKYSLVNGYIRWEIRQKIPLKGLDFEIPQTIVVGDGMLRDPEVGEYARCDYANPQINLVFSEALSLLSHINQIGISCSGANARICLSTIITAFDVSGNGILSKAEIARIIRALSFFVTYYSHDGPAVPIEKLMVGVAMSAIVGPYIASTLIEGSDYNDDGGLDIDELMVDRYNSSVDGAVGSLRTGALDSFADLVSSGLSQILPIVLGMGR
uniref:ankyrin repeat domain-containing protein n=1 Tax=Pararhizobium sp. IMCC3301 TaxID=3067904 RepID=UPI0027416BDA|nr:ankyrin repeat domain-containing protein [Pararhizobium sp. IMCC3301]